MKTSRGNTTFICALSFPVVATCQSCYDLAVTHVVIQSVVEVGIFSSGKVYIIYVKVCIIYIYI